MRERDWSDPDLDRWAERIAHTVAQGGGRRFVAAAHSFGCLGFADCLAQQPDSSIVSALLVAPAEPDRFGLGGRLPPQRLPCRTTMVASDTDPWMKAASAQRWVQAALQRAAREPRPAPAGWAEWSFAW